MLLSAVRAPASNIYKVLSMTRLHIELLYVTVSIGRSLETINKPFTNCLASDHSVLPCRPTLLQVSNNSNVRTAGVGLAAPDALFFGRSVRPSICLSSFNYSSFVNNAVDVMLPRQCRQLLCVWSHRPSVATRCASDYADTW